MLTQASHKKLSPINNLGLSSISVTSKLNSSFPPKKVQKSPEYIVEDNQGNDVYIGHHKEIDKHFKDGKYQNQKSKQIKISVDEDEELIRKFLNQEMPVIEKQLLIKPMK